MDKTLPTLPKGHVSCLSDAFRYIRASETDIVKTFARIRDGLLREEQRAAGQRLGVPQREVGSGRTS
jgi:hypothetical protein